MTTVTQAQQDWLDKYEEFYQASLKIGLTDPFNYNRSREMHTAITLGLKISPTLSGADGIEESGEEAEFKSTIDERINGTYNGISVFDSWDEQEAYLINDKIGKYNKHYFVRYEGNKIAELFCLSGNDVLMILLPKLKKDWTRKRTGNQKDKRLSATVCMTEIKRFGKRIK